MCCGGGGADDRGTMKICSGVKLLALMPWCQLEVVSGGVGITTGTSPPHPPPPSAPLPLPPPDVAGHHLLGATASAKQPL